MNIGKRAGDMNPILSEQQIQAEIERPKRLSLDEFAYFNEYPVNEFKDRS